MWQYRVTLVDSYGKKTVMSYNLNVNPTYDGVTFDAAMTEAAAIKSSLAAITDAFISEEKLVAVFGSDNQLPAGEVLIGEELVLTVHLNAPTEAEKLASIRVPAPTQANVFLADGYTLDVNSTQVQDYVSALSSNALISDGEQINTASGIGGIKTGWLRTKATSYR